MKWVPDRSGRFPRRPHYAPDELDRECEEIVTTFLRATRHRVAYPISTNDLTILIERETDDLDLYADLSREGEDVEGLTDFYRGRKPTVRIARALVEEPRRENRLRTTLTHELGHVKFHDFLWSFEQPPPLPLFGDLLGSPSPFPRCKRETMADASTIDWMEWQAGYVSGALLMPITALERVVGGLLDELDLVGPFSTRTPAGQELLRRVQATFQVSADAARVRLLKRGHLIERDPPPALFTPCGA